MARRCRECMYCKRTSFVRSHRVVGSRQKYYCVHPDLANLPKAIFQSKEYGIIGYGDHSSKGLLTIKTHPRWCPMEVFR